MEEKSNRVTLQELATQLSLATEFAVTGAMEAYNQSLVDPRDRLSARTLATIKKQGVSQRNMHTLQWLDGFKKFVTDGNVDLERGTLIQQMQTALQNEPVDARFATASANVAPEGLPAEIQGFADLLTTTLNRNEGLREERAGLSGYYRLIRASTSEAKSDFYEEPMFLGDAGQPSWICRSSHADPQFGFSFPGQAISYSMFLSAHRPRMLAGSMLTLYGFDQDRPRFQSGIMLRLSDDRSRPAAMPVLVMREEDADTIASWDAAVKARQAHSCCRTIKADDDPEMHAMLTAFEIDQNVKTHKFETWLDLMHQFDADPSQP